MKNNILYFLLLLIIACNNDIDKNITTDFQIEGNEIFNTGLALNESLIYGFYTLDQYRLENDSLPGCPTVSVDEAGKIVTLSFSTIPDCPSQKLQRSGKITLQYHFTNTLETKVVMQYANYKFKSFEVQGKREFKQNKSLVNPNRRSETFEDLIIIDQYNSSTKISGTFEHQLQFVSGALSEFTSTGSLEGRNITGRNIIMTQTNPKKYSISCIDQGFVLPLSGSEKWEIFRREQLTVAHTVEFSQEGNCKSEAEIRLSDGRLMVLSQ